MFTWSVWIFSSCRWAGWGHIEVTKWWSWRQFWLQKAVLRWEIPGLTKLTLKKACEPILSLFFLPVLGSERQTRHNEPRDLLPPILAATWPWKPGSPRPLLQQDKQLPSARSSDQTHDKAPEVQIIKAKKLAVPSNQAKKMKKKKCGSSGQLQNYLRSQRTTGTRF